MSSNGRFAQTWDLDSLYPHPEKPEFRQLLDEYKRDLTALANDSESLPAVEPQHAGSWADFFERVTDVFARSTDLGAFLGCHEAADTENKAFLRLEAVLSALGPLRNQVFTNIELAFRPVSDEDFEAFFSAEPRLNEIQFFLEECRLNASLRLPKDQEMLAADLAVDGIYAWGRLYDRLSGELRIEVMEKGEIVRKSPGQLLLDSPERSVRQNRFYAGEKAWRGIADTCADALNHIAGARLTKYKRLGVQDHLDVPLIYNRMQRETLETMWSAIVERKGCLVKFFERKAELLGLPQLAWYDLQAPLPQEGRASDGELPYDEACDTIIDTFSSFSDELGSFGKMALDDRWIEVENRSGKRQGGFCTGLPVRKQSRIFMTYTGTPDSMSTLAHELGHAYHSYVLRDQPYLLQDYPMNLAETASTFAEAILGERRLQRATREGEKLGILNNMLCDAVAFMMNIHARFLFEDRFHAARRDGEVDAEGLTDLIVAAQKEAYLDSLSEWSQAFWISKLHFYITGLPFYNFPYTFGYLLSLGLYSAAGEMGDSFPAKYRDLLIATGCMNAEEAVKSTLGYDLTEPGFWMKSLDVVEARVNQFLDLSEPMLG